MSIKDYLEKKSAFIELARLEATGTPEQLANRYNISKRSLHRFIENLKSEGLEIKYSRKMNSYCIIQ